MVAVSFVRDLLVTRAEALDVGRRIDVGRRNRKDQNAREPTFHRVLTARRPPNAPRLTVLQARVDLNCDARGIGNQGRGAAEQHLADDALLGDPIAEDLNVPDPDPRVIQRAASGRGRRRIGPREEQARPRDRADRQLTFLNRLGAENVFPPRRSDSRWDYSRHFRARGFHRATCRTRAEAPRASDPLPRRVRAGEPGSGPGGAQNARRRGR